MAYLLFSALIVVILVVIYYTFIWYSNEPIKIVLVNAHSTTHIDNPNEIINLLTKYKKHLQKLYSEIEQSDCNAVKGLLVKAIHNLRTTIDKNPVIYSERINTLELKNSIIKNNEESIKKEYNILSTGFKSILEESSANYTSLTLIVILIANVNILIDMFKNKLCNTASIRYDVLLEITDTLSAACVKKQTDSFMNNVEVATLPASYIEPFHVRNSANYSKRAPEQSIAQKQTYAKKYNDKLLGEQVNIPWGDLYNPFNHIKEKFTGTSDNSYYSMNTLNDKLLDDSLEGLSEQDILNGNSVGNSVGNIIDATSNYTTVVNSCNGKVVKGDLSDCREYDMKLLNAFIEGSGLIN